MVTFVATTLYIKEELSMESNRMADVTVTTHSAN